MNAADIVIDAVRRVEFGPLTTFRNLSVLALSIPGDRDASYLTLDEALAQRSVHVAEVSEGGHVPELKIVNEGELPVLLLDGDELLGAKQNRVINLTIVAPASGSGDTGVLRRVGPMASCIQRFCGCSARTVRGGPRCENAAGDQFVDGKR